MILQYVGEERVEKGRQAPTIDNMGYQIQKRDSSPIPITSFFVFGSPYVIFLLEDDLIYRLNICIMIITRVPRIYHVCTDTK